MTKNQKNVILVLNRLTALVQTDEYLADGLIEPLNSMLTDLNAEDMFGTEGQCDPRGDFREGDWCMTHVEK